jgi:hypothetical protein
VAVFAGVVGLAAFHFDGDDVEGGVVVEATGLGVEVKAVDFGDGWGHGSVEGMRRAESGCGPETSACRVAGIGLVRRALPCLLRDVL